MNIDIYPMKLAPIYKEKIWGGRNLARLFGRALPDGRLIGESWELADLVEGVSMVADGPAAGRSLTDMPRVLGPALLGRAAAMPDGRFPLLLKLLDASDILSLQVHPDEQTAAKIGPPAASKTECWYVLESRGGFIYKGLRPGATLEDLRAAVERNRAEDVVRRLDVTAGEFHYLPAGTVHAIGSGVVLAEVQTPSDTTYRVTDWGRGRELHLEMALRCIRPELTSDEPPGAEGDVLLKTRYFEVARRRLRAGAGGAAAMTLEPGCCKAMMVLAGRGEVVHDGPTRSRVALAAGQTLLLPAALDRPTVAADEAVEWLEITLPARPGRRGVRFNRRARRANSERKR